MEVEICSVGGYDEVGKNMTAIKIDDVVIICDLGIHLENYIKLTEDEDLVKITPQELMDVDAVPNINIINKWKDKVRAIIPTHAHLDHIGAIPFLAQFYDASVICTPFTAAVLTAIINDAQLKFNNEINILNANSSKKITDEITVEFVSITHSTLLHRQ